MKRLWSPEENEWDAFVRWARKFYEWDGFEENERDYKLEVAARLESAKDALLAGRRGLDAEDERSLLVAKQPRHWRQSQPFSEVVRDEHRSSRGGAPRIVG